MNLLRVRPARFAGLATLLLLAMIALGSLVSSPALAASGVSGQLENWEPIEFGEEPGELLNPTTFGVDPVDGSTYIVSNNLTQTEGRVDKFTSTGEFKGSATISRQAAAGGLELPLSIIGIAVDHADHQFYVVVGECLESTPIGEAVAAQKLLVYSTEPSASSGEPELQLIGSHPLPSPTEAGAIFNPTELHVEETTGELVINGVNAASEAILQRLSSTGTEGAVYTESGTTLKSTFLGVNFAFDVAADGTTYILANPGEGAFPQEKIEGFTLPAGFDSLAGPLAIAPIPGFTAAGVAEGWGNRRSDLVLKNEEGTWGPEVALVTALGGEETLYWKTGNPENEHSYIRIHGYSIQQEATTPAFGGGPEEPECGIESLTTSLAPTADGNLMVFSQGKRVENLSAEPAWGPNVYRFGSGGGECGQFDPAPSTELTVGGHPVSNVAQGSSVNLDASGSEEGETTIESLVWMIEDPAGQVEPITVGGPTPSLLQPHTFSEEGTYTIRLKVKTTDPVGPTPEAIGAGLNNSDRVGDEFVAKPKTLIVTAAGATTPVVNSISPTKGPLGGETLVTITGEHLTGATAVKFGATTGIGLADVSDTELTVKTPSATAAGKVPIEVTTADGSVVAAEEFEYEAPAAPAPVVSSISPIKGPAGGGTKVTITGLNLTGATQVKFGNAAATGVKVVADTEVEATSPAGAGGSKVGVTVVTAGGASASTPADEFEYEPVVKHKLTITKGGAGSGTVQCDGGACSAEYTVGTGVTLTGLPDSGSTFAGWSGGGCAGAGPCKVVIGASDVTVGATFDKVPPANNGGGSSGGNGTPPGNVTPPPPGGGKKALTPTQKLKEQRQKAIAKCKKMKGRAKAQCLKKANQIGKPKKKDKKKPKKLAHELVRAAGREVL
jgi:IPT/TIG domain/Divergent InlB B-repeat domain